MIQPIHTKPINSLAVVIQSPVSIFVIALMLRIGYLLVMSTQQTGDAIWAMFPDSRVYVSISEHIAGSIDWSEPAILMAGPGYGFILFLWKSIAGNSAWFYLSLQALIGALNAALIFGLASSVNLSKATATLAGLIYAFSITAIALGAAVLGETFFVFFMLILLWLIVKYLKRPNHAIGIFIVFIGIALPLVRAAGMLMIPFLAIAISMYGLFSKEVVIADKKRSIIVFALIILGSCVWPLRNYVKHDIFTIAETGTRAARLYWTAEVVAGTDQLDSVKAVRNSWDQQIAMLYPEHEPTAKEMHDFDVAVVRDTLKAHPGAMLKEYLNNIFTNITERSYLQRTQIPAWHEFWYQLDNYVLRPASSPVVFLTVFGALVLWYKRQRRAVVILGSVYLYFALTCGATFWQGSRIFYPGAACGAILQSAGLVFVVRLARDAYFRYTQKLLATPEKP